MDPSSPHWHSRTEAPLVVQKSETIHWDDTTDVLVVGLGGAGVCAALEALEQNVQVAAVDRFCGGGATAMSGGVYYGGGGTEQQQKAGFQDTPEEMYNYLKLEAQDVVSEDTLREFCSSSSDNLQWLEKYGVKFSAALCPVKTSYPSDKYFLYYSGNELQPAYSSQAKPAPRGHRAVGKGLSGPNFFTPLKESALARGLKLYSYSEVRRLVLDEHGKIIGVELLKLPENPKAMGRLAKINRKFSSTLTLLSPKRALRLAREADAILTKNGERILIGVSKSVILSAGGFSHNRDMVAYHAPKYINAAPLGSIGCNGSGIRLGQSVGSRADRMDNISAWLNILPPSAFAKGIIVNGLGERIVSEDCYGAKIGYHVVEDNNGRAFIILDRKLYWQALRQALPGPGKLFRTQCAPALLSLLFGATKAKTVEELAVKCKMQPDKLKGSIEHYNRAIEGKESTRFPKHVDYLSPLVHASFYALDISVTSKTYFFPTISLGGLAVAENTGQVISIDGGTIPKLYAAGRNAIGVASNTYVSGLSISDCVFSGRRAGRYASVGAASQDSKREHL